MLSIPSDLEGKRALYGDFHRDFEKEGFHICGNWEYYHAYFDAVLHQQEGVTIYVRLPAKVVQGKLDQEDALLEFGRPFLIKHIVHIGIVEGEADYSALNAIGLDQFQAPLDPDDRIEQEGKWRRAGRQAISRIEGYVH